MRRGRGKGEASRGKEQEGEGDIVKGMMKNGEKTVKERKEKREIVEGEGGEQTYVRRGWRGRRSQCLSSRGSSI